MTHVAHDLERFVHRSHRGLVLVTRGGGNASERLAGSGAVRGDGLTTATPAAVEVARVVLLQTKLGQELRAHVDGQATFAKCAVRGHTTARVRNATRRHATDKTHGRTTKRHEGCHAASEHAPGSP